MLYLRVAKSWDWHRVMHIILSQDPSQAVISTVDDMSLAESYAYLGAKNNLLQLLDELPRDIFRRHMNSHTSLLHLCTQQGWNRLCLNYRRSLV